MPYIKNVFNRKDMISFGKYCKVLITDVKLSAWCVMGEDEKKDYIGDLLEDWIAINYLTSKNKEHEHDFE
jgi:beta-glucosidase/6-phospho-beta-glucosidase/beta-galactosidase